MKKITNEEVLNIADSWFELNYDHWFNEKPKSYKISIDKEDWMRVDAIFENGQSDFAGMGNIYKFLWERGL